MFCLDAKRFVVLKALDLKEIFHKELNVIYGKGEVASFFYLCLEHYVNLPKFQLALEPEFTLTKEETNSFLEALNNLKQQKPIQYILGEMEFYGSNFKVNENVLIPRPETEGLVDLIINGHSNENDKSRIKILDIGTGSGCIAVSLAKHLQNAEVYALDISKEALQVANQNAEQNNVNIKFIEASILDRTTWDREFENLNFDIIVSNPPYVRQLEKVEIKPNVLDNEPHLALFVEDGNPLLFYKAIINFAVNKLKPKGQLYFEINQYLGRETKQLLTDANFEAVKLKKDLYGNDRMLFGTKK